MERQEDRADEKQERQGNREDKMQERKDKCEERGKTREYKLEKKGLKIKVLELQVRFEDLRKHPPPSRLPALTTKTQYLSLFHKHHFSLTGDSCVSGLIFINTVAYCIFR